MGVFVLAVYLPATANRFVNLDDQLYLKTVPACYGVTPAGIAFAFSNISALYWQPITWISHEIDISMFGMNAVGHHTGSVLFHVLTASVLFIFLRRVGAPVIPSMIGTLFWALHPLRVESVAWVAERKDVLCALFYLSCMAAYISYLERPSKARYVCWFLLGTLALMSKPTAVTLPVALLLLSFWKRFREVDPRRRVMEQIPLVAVACAVVLLTLKGQSQSGALSSFPTLSLGDRAANSVVFYLIYLRKIVWPTDLACFYPYPPHSNIVLTFVAVFVLCGLTGFAMYERRCRPWLLFGWLFFVVTLLPNIGLIQAGRQSIADRFTEIPMVGLTVGVAFTVSECLTTYPSKQRIIIWVCGALLSIFAVLSVVQIEYWRDSETLFRHALSVEDSDYIEDNLGELLMGDGRDKEAEFHLRVAVRLDPSRFEHHNNLANAFLRSGNLTGAAREAQAALRLSPRSLSVAETLALVDLGQKDYTGVLNEFTRAVRLGAESGPIAAELNDIGASLASRGQPSEAEPLVRRAIDLDTHLVQARKNLVLILLDQHRVEEAKASLADAIKATGDRPEYTNLLPSEKVDVI